MFFLRTAMQKFGIFFVYIPGYCRFESVKIVTPGLILQSVTEKIENINENVLLLFQTKYKSHLIDLFCRKFSKSFDSIH